MAIFPLLIAPRRCEIDPGQKDRLGIEVNSVKLSVRLAEARRLVEGTEDSFEVVYFDADGHLDLKATYDAADTSLSPSTTAES